MLAPNEPTLARVFAPRTTIAPDGTVEGYASLFGEIDQARDMVMAGAFRADADAARRAPHPDAVPARPGRADRRLARAASRIRAGSTRAAGSFPTCSAAARCWRWCKAGAIDGLSIGFKTVQGPRRSAHAHPQDRAARSLGDFHRHVPAADRRARARRQGCGRGDARRGRPARAAVPPPSALLVRAHARRSGVEGDLPRRETENEERGGCVARCTSRLSRRHTARSRAATPAGAALAARSPHPRLDRRQRAARHGRPQGRVRADRRAERCAPRSRPDNADVSRQAGMDRASARALDCGPMPTGGCDRTPIAG